MSRSLDDIKAGDTVVLVTDYGRCRSLRLADRVTKTQIIVGNARFNRAHGRLVGGSGYDVPSINAASVEEIERVRDEERMRAEMGMIDWLYNNKKKISRDALRRIAVIAHEEYARVKSEEAK